MIKFILLSLTLCYLGAVNVCCQETTKSLSKQDLRYIDSLRVVNNILGMASIQNFYNVSFELIQTEYLKDTINSLGNETLNGNTLRCKVRITNYDTLSNKTAVVWLNFINNSGEYGVCAGDGPFFVSSKFFSVSFSESFWDKKELEYEKLPDVISLKPLESFTLYLLYGPYDLGNELKTKNLGKVIDGLTLVYELCPGVKSYLLKTYPKYIVPQRATFYKAIDFKYSIREIDDSYPQRMGIH